MEKRLAYLEQTLSSVISLLQDQNRAQMSSHEEIQWNRNYVETKSFELIKDRTEHSREQRNCVIWDLELESLRKYSNCKSDHELTTAFAHEFIQNYLGPIDKRDFKAKRLVTVDEKKKNKYFRLLVTFTDVATAQRLIGRCKIEGFKKIRCGLTRLERDFMFQTKKKVEELNSNLGPNSDYAFVRRNMYTIVKVHRSDSNLEIDSNLPSPEQIPAFVTEQNESQLMPALKNCGEYNAKSQDSKVKLGRLVSRKNITEKNTRKKDNLSVTAKHSSPAKRLQSCKSNRKLTLRSYTNIS